MPITESRLKGGTLTLDAGGPTPYAASTQATNVCLVPKTDEVGDTLEVLSGDTITPDDETSWSLAIKAVQDFDDAAGFVAFTLDHDGELVDYTWAPSGAAGVSYTGTCRVRPVEIGGDVNSRLDTDAEWPCTAKPTATYPGP